MGGPFDQVHYYVGDPLKGTVIREVLPCCGVEAGANCVDGLVINSDHDKHQRHHQQNVNVPAPTLSLGETRGVPEDPLITRVDGAAGTLPAHCTYTGGAEAPASAPRETQRSSGPQA